MKRRAVAATCAGVLGLTGLIGLLGTPLWAQSLPTELGGALPQATLSGEATLRFLGFSVYQARLWVGPGFSASDYAQQLFALELVYLRSFKGPDIAQRSVQEMRRQGPLDEALAQRWLGQMQALFPDVAAGDRITGLHQPGAGASFWFNGRSLGGVREPAFARQFFGIWLAPQTSEPQMRQALLAQATPGPRL